MLLMLILLVQFIDYALLRDIPSYVHLCRRHDPELNKCIVNTIYEIIPYLYKGIPEFDLPSIDPLHISNMTTNTGNLTAVQLEASVTNVTVLGLLAVDIKSYTVDLDHGRLAAVLDFPKLRIQANYNLKGKALIFELNGEGLADLNCTSITADVEWYGNFYTKKQEEYLRFVKIEVKVKLKNMQVHFANLFEGNEVLTESVNKAINENMESLQTDLIPIAEVSIGQILIDIFNRPFSLFSIKQLFLD